AAMQARREACKADPEKCRREQAAMREKMCAQNPERCKEMKAKMEQRREVCKADPEKCRKEHQARAAEHFKKTDADGNGSLSRAEAEKGMPRLARHFDMIDANKDGQLSVEELTSARKAHGAKAPGKS
ncbi:MAG: EF-hand domain-containing protein, partial [Phenylobacterium sp.]|uniref:EF-hand domain-containing protein n=1 Tax=Phenylobacterium sp. TaxID=1871053 RepID=UPI002732DA10